MELGTPSTLQMNVGCDRNRTKVRLISNDFISPL